MSRKHHYVVYALTEPPGTENAGQIRYIGKSFQGKQRYYEHIKPCNLKAKTHKIHWIKSLQENGLNPEFIILEEFETASPLDEAEDFYIEYFRALGCKLTNSCDGGKGTPGRKYSVETLEKMREKALLRGPKGTPAPNAKPHRYSNGVEQRHCSKCDEWKTLNFYIFDKKSEKYQANCKPCRAKYRREKQPYKRVSEEQVAQSYAARGEASKERTRKQF